MIKQRFAQENMFKLSNKFENEKKKVIESENQKNIFSQYQEVYTKESDDYKKMISEFKNNREVLTKVFYETLYEGMLNIKKLNPSDKFQYLSEFIFNKAFE